MHVGAQPSLDDVLPLIGELLKGAGYLNVSDTYIFISISLSPLGNMGSNLFYRAKDLAQQACQARLCSAQSLCCRIDSEHFLNLCLGNVRLNLPSAIPIQLTYWGVSIVGGI